MIARIPAVDSVNDARADWGRTHARMHEAQLTRHTYSSTYLVYGFGILEAKVGSQ